MTHRFNRDDGTFALVDILNDVTGSTPFFQVTKSASQTTTDAAFTLVTWDTENVDVGSHFSSNAWIPPAGVVQLLSSALIGGTFSTGNAIAIRILKNGAALSQFSNNAVAGGAANFVSIVAFDLANGTDSYAVDVYADTSAGSPVVNSGSNSGFSGVW